MFFAFSYATVWAQPANGKEEYNKAIVALGKGRDKKANQLLEAFYKKGDEPACLKIQRTYWEVNTSN